MGRRVLVVCAWLALGAPAFAGTEDAGTPTPAPTPTHTAALPSPPKPTPTKPTPTPTATPIPSATQSPTPPPAPKKPVAPKPQKPGTAKPPVHAGQEDENVRRQVAGAPTQQDIALGAESPELRALHEAERDAFPPAGPDLGGVWPHDLPAPLFPPSDRPIVHATGAPPALTAPQLPSGEGGKDVSWLSQLVLPDLPVRFEPRVVRYLELYKTDTRARSAIAFWMRRSERYRAIIEPILAKKGMPKDLIWLAMIESGFDPVIRSPAGAVGMWQFMPETGKSYGLPLDRWVDERMNFELATSAAADFLGDLYRRFQSWDLAMAAYNMGYGGVLNAVRKYNSNDFWRLSTLEGSLPWETTLYVPKILAAAIVAHNPRTFGFDPQAVDAPVTFERATVPFNVPLSQIATVAGCTQKELEQLNPELRAGRTPPKDSDAAGATPTETAVTIRVPLGKSAAIAANGSKLKSDDAGLERYVVRFGESLESIAQAHGTTVEKLVSLNTIAPGEVVRGGALLLVPHAPAVTTAANAVEDGKQKPVVVVPSDIFVYPDRKRVFYKVLVGDTLPAVANALKVPVEDLLRWNDLDPSARLTEGMTIQAFVPKDADLSKAVTLAETDVRVLVAGTDDFFTFFEGAKGRRRVLVTAKKGDTLDVIGKRYGVSASTMERINRRARSEALVDGETVVAYVAPDKSPASQANAKTAQDNTDEPAPLGPLPAAPHPELLPPLQ